MKADVGLGVIIVILIIVLALGWLVNEGYKECHNDSDCADNQYCTSGFECKDIPQPTQASPKQSIISDYGAWVVGLSLIVAAVIIKWETFFPFLKKKEKKKQEKDKDGYVDLSKSHNAEEKGLYEDFLREKY